ncbi:hypothetical protein DITRI_Ditri06bG0100400 [Diplodiscus trichospermus]
MSSTEEDSATKAFVEETLRQEVNELEDMEKANEYEVNQTDLNKPPTPMLQSVKEMHESPTTSLPILSIHSLQQQTSLTSIYNSKQNIPTITEKESSEDESIQLLNHEQNNVDDPQLSQAMKTPNHGSSSHSSGCWKKNVDTSKEYHLSTSNLPHEFHLGFSSRLEVLQVKELSQDESILSLNHQKNNVDDPQLSEVMATPNHDGTIYSSGCLKNSVEAFKEYHPPTSNLPPELHFGFSFKVDYPQIHQGTRKSGSSSAKTNFTNCQPFSQIPTYEPSTKSRSQEFGFQALLNQDIPLDNFYVNVDRPIQPRSGRSSTIGAPSLFKLDDTPSNPNKRKITWQDDTSPNLNRPFIDWMSLGEGNQGRNNSVPATSGSRPKIIKNGVYDPAYAAIGLPVDPHLRMFLAKHANGMFLWQ